MGRLWIIFILIPICFIIQACSHSEDTKSLSFSIEYVPVFSSTKKCEVILLTGDDKRVIDRKIIQTNTVERFNIQSPTDKITLVIIDSLHYPNVPPKFTLTVFRNIMPGYHWKIPASGGVANHENLTGPDLNLINSAVINYTNMPDYDDSEDLNKPIFAIENGGFAWNVIHENHSEYASFACTQPLPINYSYLLIPSIGKYKFTNPSSTKSQIDLTVMNDAKKVVFGGLEKVTMKGLFDLVAHIDKKNWIRVGKSYAPWDMLYPEEDFINNYEFSFFGYGPNTYYDYYSVLDKVPSSIDLIDDSYYTLNSNGSDVSISFPKDGITYYYLDFHATNLRLSIYSPTSVTNTKPVNFIKSLNSSYLQGQNITDINIDNLGLISVKPLGYQGYWNYVLTPGMLSANLISNATSYYLDFRK